MERQNHKYILFVTKWNIQEKKWSMSNWIVGQMGLIKTTRQLK